MNKSSNTHQDLTASGNYSNQDVARLESRSGVRNQGEALLEENGIAFEIESGGAHLIVNGPDGLIDYWPGTGLWTSHKGKSGQGIYSLVRQIGTEKSVLGSSTKLG